jgi:hypothetical protein
MATTAQPGQTLRRLPVNLADATLENLFEQADGDADLYMRLFELLGDMDITITGVDGLEVPILEATMADLHAHKGYTLQRLLSPPFARN